MMEESRKSQERMDELDSQLGFTQLMASIFKGATSHDKKKEKLDVSTDDEYSYQPKPSCVKSLDRGIDKDFAYGISADLIPTQDVCIQDFVEKEYQAQLEASSCDVEARHTPHGLHSLRNQLKVSEDEIMVALSHHDRMCKMTENYLWKVQLERRQKEIKTESSHDSLMESKEGMGALKTNYLHLLSDHDHLLNLVVVYSDALRRKEDEVDKLTHKLMVSSDSLRSTQLALQDFESHIDELFLELSLTRDSLCIVKAQSSMASKTHVEDSGMGSPSIQIHDTKTSVLAAGSGISRDLSTRLYVNSFEIDIG